MKTILVAGARPNFMKIAPIIRAIEEYNNSWHSSLVTRHPLPVTRYLSPVTCHPSPVTIHYLLVHTGQHYDYEMSKVFFEDLELPEPDIYLGVGSGTHAEQTGKVMIEFEKVLIAEKPDLVIVVGDVNSTLACALATSKMNYVNSKSSQVTREKGLSPFTRHLSPFTIYSSPFTRHDLPFTHHYSRPLIAHVEAGLRSFDRSMPEEINRILTDQISDFLFCTTEDDVRNLKNEGIVSGVNSKSSQVTGEKDSSPVTIYLSPFTRHHLPLVVNVGDVMVDSLLFNLEKAKKSNILEKLGLQKELTTAYCLLPTAYCLLTLHRPSNVDDREAFLRIINALTEIARHIPIIFPIHPRTRKQIETFDLQHYFNSSPVTRHLSQDPVTCHSSRAIYLLDPLGYLDFLSLMIHSKFVMTDSGGIQEETTVLGIPCLTLRNTTERPITISQGTNTLVWNDTQKIIDEAFKLLDVQGKKGNRPELWDGKSAERIVEILTR